jgi:hypothetical protein
MINIDEKTISFILGIIGFIGSVVTIYQFLKNRELKKTIEKLQRTEEAEMWTYIGSIVKTYDALCDARKLLSDKPNIDYESLLKVQSARRGTIDLYILLLKDAVLKEEDFSEDTIKRWIELGRLENEWRISQARRLLPHTKDKLLEK